MSLSECKLIKLPKATDHRGSLTFIEGQHIPFDIERVFYLYDVGEERGGHAHKELHQLLICLAGEFYVILDDGADSRVVWLHRPWEGLYIPPMVWVRVTCWSEGAICLVLCSDEYDEVDYIRDFKEFLTSAC